MKNISIITDGSCDIPAEVIEKYGIKLIPLHFQFEDQIEYGSERKMEITEFYNRLANGEVAKTSASSPSAAIQVLKEELEKGNDIICVTLSSALSCTFNNIRLASLELLDSYPESRIAVIDSLTGSMAMGMLVVKACMMRDEKYSYDQIVEYLEENKQSFHVEFYVNDLQYLARGGRLNPAIAKIGGLIGIKPILSVTDNGVIESVCKARKTSGATKQIKERFLASNVEREMICILHSNNLDHALSLKADLELEQSFAQVFITEIGPSIGSHTGPGCLGLAYIKQ
ncbi:DegV family protein [Pradoshia sp. D12]|uniref:DegV family protein n=1 Tax=Bacillaceae TaxID=186817 RepID=UPI00112C7665|nr:MULTISPECIES: DegV family protein [Bacillaceae]QFK70154.1 DegV family protein [Pradoshia sp. D12]TPF70933.1 DegV family protein [Bacillus sp. D12]